MAENSKLKILYILDIMKKTDELHPLNTTQISQKLLAYGVKAERKSIVRDLECLEDAGYSIIRCENHNQGWYMVDQVFEEYELKMLADAVAFANFLSVDDSRELIKKIKQLATKEGEKLIDATTHIDVGMKLDNKKFNLKFDQVMRAITDHNQISFQYEELGKNNQKVLKRDGHVYQVSPYFIAISNDEYFAITNPIGHNHVTHFRIEMMTNINILDDKIKPMSEVVELKDIGKTKTIGDYLRENVNMRSGKTRSVRLRCIDSCRHDIQLKYGRDIRIQEAGENYFKVNVNVVIDKQGFYQWIASYGDNIVIEKPQEAIDYYKEYLQRTLNAYT